MPEMTQPTPATPGAEPDIVVIPEKFYGAALKARVPEAGEMKPDASVSAPAGRPMLPLVIGGIVFLLAAIGGGIYVFRDLIFKTSTTPTPKPQQVVETPKPTPKVPPQAPSSLVATSTNPQSVSLRWVDNASNESGYRVDRADESGSFASLTPLPPNSNSFLDTSVQPGKSYTYRVIAMNQDGESQPSGDARADVSQLPPPPPENPKLPPAGLDTDSDGLTDLEEPLFGSDPKNPDTDADGFLDGNEVFHLYNPNGRAPAKLIDAKLAKVINGSIGWTMQIPNPWTAGFTNPDGSKVTITTGHGETLELTIEDNPTKQPVLQWYLAKHPEMKADQILQYRTKRGYEGILVIDPLTTYLPWGDKVFVFHYDMDGQSFINFRTAYSMMLNSLELSGVPQISPAALTEPLPFEPAATTTGVVTQPEAVTSSTQNSTP